MKSTKFLILSILASIFLLTTSCTQDDNEINEEPEIPEISNTKPSIELLSPSDNTELSSSTTEFLLTWKGTDSDDNALTYDLYFGETLPSVPSVKDLTVEQYQVLNLIENKTYQWKVTVNDGNTTVESSTQNFTVKEKIKGVVLEWQNVNASAYDLYFGESSANQKIVSNTKELTHLFQNLEIGKRYYYRVYPKGSNSTFEEHYFYYREEGVKIFDGNISLSDQEGVKAFSNNGFTEVTGLLSIKQNYKRDIRELGWLKDLTQVGSLSLSYIEGLTSLYGFHNLSFIGNLSITNVPGITEITFDKLRIITGSLTISGNKNLEKVSMAKLVSISGDLWLGGKVTFLLNTSYGYSRVLNTAYGNPLLSNISFESLKYVYGNIYLYKNESLDNLNFLSKIEGVYKNFIIWDNDALTDISALSNFTAVAQSFAIVGNDNLTNLSGLHKLTIVAWDFLISDNKMLESIDFNALKTIGKLQIGYNPKIQNISSLSSLRQVAKGVTIYQNNQLNNFCGLYSLYNYGQISGSTYITENSYNPSVWQISNGYCSN